MTIICFRDTSAPDKKGFTKILLGQYQYFTLNIFFDFSLEPSHRDGSNEESQYMFLLRHKKTHVCIILNILSYLELWDTQAINYFLATVFRLLFIESFFRKNYILSSDKLDCILYYSTEHVILPFIF